MEEATHRFPHALRALESVWLRRKILFLSQALGHFEQVSRRYPWHQELGTRLKPLWVLVCHFLPSSFPGGWLLFSSPQDPKIRFAWQFELSRPLQFVLPSQLMACPRRPQAGSQCNTSRIVSRKADSTTQKLTSVIDLSSVCYPMYEARYNISYHPLHP